MLKHGETKIKKNVVRKVGQKMGLMKLTDRIYYLPHNPDVDRPMLAYIKGSRLSLAIDAGYSENHVASFYDNLEQKGFTKPDFTVITHWHYDHTFGMHALEGISIAHQNTNKFLQEQQEFSKDREYINVLKKEDVHFQREYEGLNELNIVLSDIEFSNEVVLHLGELTAVIFHTESPHSEDTVCIYIPEEKVLFLGDATSEDFFNGGYIDKEKLKSIIHTIEKTDFEYGILAHCEPLKKGELLAYLNSIR